VGHGAPESNIAIKFSSDLRRPGRNATSYRRRHGG